MRKARHRLGSWLARFIGAAVIAISFVATSAPRLVPVATTERISISCEPQLEATARKLANSGEALLDRISADLVDLPVPHRIQVKLVRDAADLAAVAPAGRGAPPWAIGVTYPDLGIATIALRRGAQVVDPITTLRHELGHLALGVAVGDRAPHWLHEGFAYQHSAEWSWDRAETLAGMVWFGGVIALDDLDRSFPAEESPANRAYAESYDFVGYLSRRGRWEDTGDDGDRWPFRRFLSRVGHGATLDAAAMKEFGKPLHALFDEWREELTQRYLTAPIGLMGLAVWLLCAVLLTLAWWSKRRSNKRRIAQWERDERAQEPPPAANIQAEPQSPLESDDAESNDPTLN